MHSKKIIETLLCSTVMFVTQSIWAAELPPITEHGSTTELIDTIGVLTADSNTGFELTKDTEVYNSSNPNGTVMTKGTLMIAGKTTAYPNAKAVYGALAVTDTDSTNANSPRNLIVAGVGTATVNQNNQTVTTSKYWTSSKKGESSAVRPAIYAKNSDVNIISSVFAHSNNTGTEGTAGQANGGALGLGAYANAAVDTSVFYDNSETSDGGAIDVNDSTATLILTKNNFVSNSAKKGGAIEVDGTITKMSNNYFAKNSATDSGGAIYVYGGSIGTEASLTSSDFSDNKFIANQAKNGGAIGVTNSGKLYLNKATFKNNEATTNGGALYIKDSGSKAYMKDATFTGNEATHGGAVFVDDNAVFGDKTNTVTGSFTNNTATNHGGAIAVDADASVYLENVTITDNTGNLGGGIYNIGTTVLTGDSNNISGNTATTRGADIYNGTTGTFIFSDVTDKMDLDPSTSSTSRVFNQSNGDIFNAGTMTFNKSTMQLHNGINTTSTLSESGRKKGTVNLNNSRIDLGGYGTEGAGKIYADTVNINDNSRIQTHINKETDKYGQIIANTITVSDKGTQLDLLLPNGSRLGTNEVRTYNVLDASDSLTGDFKTVKNNVYTVSKLGDGQYQIANCTGTGRVIKDGACVCDTDNNYVKIGDTCQIKATCTAPAEVYNATSNTCDCASGYVSVGGVCTAASSSCGTNEVYDTTSGTCKCIDGYTLFNGVCTAKPTCSTPSQVYDSTSNSCVCNVGYELKNGSCQLKTTCKAPAETYDDTTGSCVCSTGYVAVNGVCKLKKQCDPTTEVYDGTTNTCKCASGYVSVGGTCQVKATCTPPAEVYDAASNTCKCAAGYVSVGGVCKPRDTKDYCPGCDQNEKNTAHGWLTEDFEAMPEGTEAREIQDELFDHLQANGASMEYRTALDGLAPDVSPLIQAHATEITRRLAAITSARFYNSMERTGYVHNDKRFYRFPRHDSNLWVQGLYGKSKYNVRKGWDMDTNGLAVGLDGHISEALRMGLSYAYTKADGTSVGRDTEIETHTGMVYGEYNPNRFYANWLALYARSQYDEEKHVFQHRVKANYDVDAIAAQLMLGRKMGPYVSGNWASGVIKPELGLRYLYTKQHGYTDSIGQKVGSADGQTLTGILGAQYTIGYTLSPSLSWYPELRAALTYDIVEPDTKMRVNLLNGSMYEVKTENMDRLGIEVGAKVGLDINRKAEVALEYEGIFKGDYTNHMGLANLKYKF